MRRAPLLQDTDLTLYVGDAREVLRELPAESVDCVATSPPFFGLRDYGTGSWEGGDEGCEHVSPRQGGAQQEAEQRERGERRGYAPGSNFTNYGKGWTAEVYHDVCARCGARRVDRQIGLEPDPETWAAELVAVFRECRRVLKPTGSLWIECGDSFAASMTSDRRAQQPTGPEGTPATSRAPQMIGRRTTGGDLKPKDLIGQPFLLAFALRADGWYWRGCYPWAKPNAMPESAKDRCTTAHSYVLHFAKSSRYFFDGDAIAEPAAWERWGDQTVPKYEGTATASGWMQPKTKAELRAMTNGSGSWDSGGLDAGKSTWPDGRKTGHTVENASKHPRSVWTIPTRGFPGAHFATWPEALAERIILAGCPKRVCGTCGKPSERLTTVSYESAAKPGQWNVNQENRAGAPRGKDMFATAGVATRKAETVGWSDCGHGNYQPGVILDPFGGSGTTAVVARRLGRRAILIELNEEYARMAAERVANWWKAPTREREPDPAQTSLLAEPGAA